MRVLFVVAMLALGLSGCADSQTFEPSGEPVMDDPSENVTVEPDTPAPDAATIVPTLVADLVNGTAPLLVNFTIDAQGGNESTAWSLDFGDGNSTEGVGVPASADHTYETVGNLTAILTVAGESQEVAISVLAGGAPAGILLATETYEVDGSILVGTQGDGIAVFDGCGLEGDVDTARHTMTIPGDFGGSAVGSGRFKLVMDLEGPAHLDSDVFLYAPDGSRLASSTDFNAVPVLGSGEFQESFEITGNYPAGDYEIVVRGCTGVEMEYSITVDYDLITV